MAKPKPGKAIDESEYVIGGPRAPLRAVLYRDRKKDWRWRIISPNGKIRADSSEGYKRKRAAVTDFVDVRTREIDASSEMLSEISKIWGSDYASLFLAKPKKVGRKK